MAPPPAPTAASVLRKAAKCVQPAVGFMKAARAIAGSLKDGTATLTGLMGACAAEYPQYLRLGQLAVDGRGELLSAAHHERFSFAFERDDLVVLGTPYNPTIESARYSGVTTRDLYTCVTKLVRVKRLTRLACLGGG